MNMPEEQAKYILNLNRRVLKYLTKAIPNKPFTQIGVMGGVSSGVADFIDVMASFFNVETSELMDEFIFFMKSYNENVIKTRNKTPDQDKLN